MATPPIHITPDLLRRYVAGQTNASEQHAVERAALEDSFVADALEGFEAMAGKKPDLKALYDQLENRVSPTPVIGLGWRTWALAASFIGVLLTGYVLWLQLESSPEISQVSAPGVTGPSQAERKDSLRTPEITQPEISLAEKPRITVKKVPADAVVTSAPPQVMAMRVMSSSDSLPVAKTPELAARSLKLSDSNFSKTGSPQAKQATDTLTLALQGKAADTQVAAQTNARVIRLPQNSVIVVDQENNPIAGALIEQKKGKKAASTNAQGQVLLPDNFGSELVISSIGYKTQTLLAPFPSVITLQADNQALSEVVVVGSEKTKRKTEAEPVTGIEAYQTYLQKNVRKPELAKEKGISGTVVLSVYIKNDGSVGTIKVKKGLGYGCDEEAIRLIKEGPQWKPAHRKGKAISSWIKIEVPFS